MKEYSEITALKKYFEKYKISIVKTDEIKDDYLYFVDLAINNKTWQILVDDEYRDFTPEKPLVNFFLTLCALELYEESTDFLNWCNFLNLSPSNSKWLTYYRDLNTIYREIEQTIGTIDSCITPLDYQLKTGVIDALFQADLESS